MNAGPIVITGGSGLLALNWACAVRLKHDVVLLTHRHQVSLAGTRSIPGRLDSIDRLRRQFELLAPALVVHTAGMTSVDECERNPQDAWFANVEIAANVARAAIDCGAGLVHISTDHLFRGDRPCHREDDPAEPVNAYARTKLEAEYAVLNSHRNALVVRTNFFGWGHRFRRSFSDWIVLSLEAGNPVRMFEDAYFTPILCDRLAEVCMALIDSGAAGVLNVVGDERLSKFEFALKLCRAFGLREDLVLRGNISSAALAAPRPYDMSLDNSLVKKTIGGAVGDVDSFIGMLKLQRLNGRSAELIEAVQE